MTSKLFNDLGMEFLDKVVPVISYELTFKSMVGFSIHDSEESCAMSKDLLAQVFLRELCITLSQVRDLDLDTQDYKELCVLIEFGLAILGDDLVGFHALYAKNPARYFLEARFQLLMYLAVQCRHLDWRHPDRKLFEGDECYRSPNNNDEWPDYGIHCDFEVSCFTRMEESKDLVILVNLDLWDNFSSIPCIPCIPLKDFFNAFKDGRFGEWYVVPRRVLANDVTALPSLSYFY